MEKSFKVVRVIGESPKGIEEAVGVALRTSADRVRGHSWIDVVDIRANTTESGEVERWQVAVDVAFEVEGGKD